MYWPFHSIAQARHWRILLDHVAKRYDEDRKYPLGPKSNLVRLVARSVERRGDLAWVEVMSSDLWHTRSGALALMESGTNDYFWPRLKPDWQGKRSPPYEHIDRSDPCIHEDVLLWVSVDLGEIRRMTEHLTWIGEHVQEVSLPGALESEEREKLDSLYHRLVVSAKQTEDLLENYCKLLLKLGL